MHRVLLKLTTACFLVLTAMASSCATTDNSSTGASTTAFMAIDSNKIQTPDTRYQDYVSTVYSDSNVWLCFPNIDDVCESDQTTTAIYADGRTEIIVVGRTSDPPVDCFYIYPTVSQDMTPNSDLVPDEKDEIATVWAQVSRYSEVCRIYAPVYRQRPVPAISALVDVPEDDLVGGPGTTGFEIAYADVFDAFRHYISNANKGRGFILIGHSQGTAMLTELLRREIDQTPILRNRFISAHLLGGAHIAAGSNEFDTISGCKQVTEIGCIIAYNTFLDDVPPPPDSWFGRTWHHASWSITSWEDLSWKDVVSAPSLCVNPRSFTSGKAELTPYFPINEDVKKAFKVETPWVTYPGVIVGECINDGTFGYLSVEIRAGLGDLRAAHISEGFDPQSGLHGFDVNIALGDLIAAAETQSVSYSESVRQPYDP
jgi:pimeloyl-ACP methyl ester carboxylesterase